MQPSLLFDQGGGTIPYSETLAPGQDVRITSVNAKWNGASASGTFLACLSLYSQSGVLLSRSFPSQQFAAGDSGVVTYAPPLGASAGGAGAVIAAATLSASALTVNGALAVTWTDDGSSAGFLDISSPAAPTFNTTVDGWIIAKAWFEVGSGANRRCAAYMQQTGSGTGRTFDYGYNDGYTQSSGTAELGCGYMGFLAAGTGVILGSVVTNFAVAADNLNAKMTAILVSNQATF